MATKKNIVILLNGELGSGTTDVGRILAQSMGLQVLNTETFVRTATSDLQASFQKLAQMEKSGEINLDSVLRGMVADRIAAGNAIIEGRSALLALDKEATLKVFLHKDKEERVELVASRRETSKEEAQADVEFSDRERSQTARLLFGIDWADSRCYDLSVNTSRFTHKEAAELILAALRTKGAL